MSVRPQSPKLCTVKTLQCTCGYTAFGETANDLLTDVEAHIAAVHTPTETLDEAVPAGGSDKLTNPPSGRSVDHARERAWRSGG